MRLFGLLGYPVGHSASPAMMNAAFQADGEAAVYVPFAVDPEHIREAFTGLAALGAVGVNVTVPHKVAAFDWTDVHTPEAQRIGAVNTIRFSTEGAIGHNTDVSGWWRSIEQQVTGTSPSFAVIGAGGAAMAILAAIATHRKDSVVRVIARREAAVAQLQERFEASLSIEYRPWEKRHEVVSESDVIVQTTPIGMWPNTADSPIEDPSVFQKGMVVQDIVYRPRETRFAKVAKAGGAKVVDGAGMLVYQGVDAYEWWLDHAAPVDVMFQAVNAHLQQEQLDHE
ncbi:shikimate dehydrogenase [Alicyclobacillus fastidiosus]|uniref:Shikimate dehydrogenase (NADP(+)) n=1 Tax=Alicyclobacillus fastidiosus TaxID=392011 RepID=A0ABV5ACK8_9BACL|nr:shikimate dehydrogenase [Alicyclobacillus fastidiosus]WEH11314.1 shikimate dehydrogenase [Alicyclobacillus fastidiosus]